MRLAQQARHHAAVEVFTEPSVAATGVVCRESLVVETFACAVVSHFTVLSVVVVVVPSTGGRRRRPRVGRALRVWRIAQRTWW